MKNREVPDPIGQLLAKHEELLSDALPFEKDVHAHMVQAHEKYAKHTSRRALALAATFEARRYRKLVNFGCYRFGC